jgi:hypothetical protein
MMGSRLESLRGYRVTQNRHSDQNLSSVDPNRFLGIDTSCQFSSHRKTRNIRSINVVKQEATGPDPQPK